MRLLYLVLKARSLCLFGCFLGLTALSTIWAQSLSPYTLSADKILAEKFGKELKSKLNKYEVQHSDRASDSEGVGYILISLMMPAKMDPAFTASKQGFECSLYRKLANGEYESLQIPQIYKISSLEPKAQTLKIEMSATYATMSKAGTEFVTDPQISELAKAIEENIVLSDSLILGLKSNGKNAQDRRFFVNLSKAHETRPRNSKK